MAFDLVPIPAAAEDAREYLLFFRQPVVPGDPRAPITLRVRDAVVGALCLATAGSDELLTSATRADRPVLRMEIVVHLPDELSGTANVGNSLLPNSGYGACEAATNELVRSISRSLDLAQLAAAIADALLESYPSILRAQRAAHAWKALANAHRFASRYDAAFSALDLAERRLAEEKTLAYDRAILRLARGITLSEARRFDAALDVLGEARQIFEDHGDLRQVAQCDLALGMTLQYLGRIVDARQTYMRVIPAARAAGDLHTVAAAYHNLGRAAADAGDFNGAVDALQQARAIFRDLDMPIESARAVWSIGAAELTAGHLESAIRILTGARRELLDLGMPEEAGLAGVDLIEALLATNARASARELAGVVIEEFRHAQLNERALHAVAYLRETADIAAPASARHVATYLRRLKDEPALLFIEPESRG